MCLCDGRREANKKTDRDMDIRTHPYPSEPISFYSAKPLSIKWARKKSPRSANDDVLWLLSQLHSN